MRVAAIAAALAALAAGFASAARLPQARAGSKPTAQTLPARMPARIRMAADANRIVAKPGEDE